MFCRAIFQCNEQRTKSENDGLISNIVSKTRWSPCIRSSKKRRHQKMRQQPSHQKGRRDTTLARAPTGEATRPSSHQKQESECGHLTQDVSLEAWDLTHGPSTDLSVGGYLSKPGTPPMKGAKCGSGGGEKPFWVELHFNMQCCILCILRAAHPTLGTSAGREANKMSS